MSWTTSKSVCTRITGGRVVVKNPDALATFQTNPNSVWEGKVEVGWGGQHQYFKMSQVIPSAVVLTLN